MGKGAYLKKITPKTGISKGVVSIWVLPDSLVYVDLEPKSKQKLFDLALSFSRNWRTLSHNLGLPLNKRGVSKLLESSRHKKISLRILKLLVNYLKQNGIDVKEEVEDSIILLAPKRGSSRNGANCIHRPHTLFNFSTEAGATVISALLHDGGIDLRLHPHYSSPMDVHSRRKVSRAFTEVFGDFDFLRSRPEENDQMYFPKIVGVILTYGLGMTPGRKVTNDPAVPSFIFDAPENVRAAFLRQAFDDEAQVHKTSRYMSFKLASKGKRPSKLLLGIKKLLKSFGIKPYGPRFVDTYTDNGGILSSRWAIDIHHQNNLLIFLDKIGFDSKHKMARLIEIVSTIKYPHFALREKPRILMKACSETQSQFGCITSSKLAKTLKRSQALAKVEIRKLRREGRLALVQKRVGNKAACYRLVGT